MFFLTNRKRKKDIIKERDIRKKAIQKRRKKLVDGISFFFIRLRIKGVVMETHCHAFF